MFTFDYVIVCVVCFVIMLFTIRYALRPKDGGEGGIPERSDRDAPNPPVPPQKRKREKELA